MSSAAVKLPINQYLSVNVLFSVSAAHLSGRVYSTLQFFFPKYWMHCQTSEDVLLMCLCFCLFSWAAVRWASRAAVKSFTFPPTRLKHGISTSSQSCSLQLSVKWHVLCIKWINISQNLKGLYNNCQHCLLKQITAGTSAPAAGNTPEKTTVG